MISNYALRILRFVNYDLRFLIFGRDTSEAKAKKRKKDLITFYLSQRLIGRSREYYRNLPSGICIFSQACAKLLVRITVTSVFELKDGS